MAVEQLAGRPVDRAYLHFLRPNLAVEVDLSPSLLESPEQIVREFQEAQSKMEFALNEGERCLRCPFYKDLCPAGHENKWAADERGSAFIRGPLGLLLLTSADVRDDSVFVLLQELLKLGFGQVESDVHCSALCTRCETLG